MAETLPNDADDKPLDPAVERVRRKLVRFMIVNLGILFIALMAVAIAIVYRAGRKPEPPASAVPELPLPALDEVVQGHIALPPGAQIAGHALSGNRLSLDLTLPGGDRAILIYDIAAGRVISRIAVTAAP